MIKTNFLNNSISKENRHYTCIACITIDSVMKKDKKYFSHVYSEECKYKIKKMQLMIQMILMILMMILIMILINKKPFIVVRLFFILLKKNFYRSVPGK